MKEKKGTFRIVIMLRYLLSALAIGSVVLLAAAGLLQWRGRVYQKRLDSGTSEIINLIQLAGYQYTFREILFFGEERSIIGIRVSDRGFLASLDIHLIAGYDLEKAFSLSANGLKEVRISLPPPEILSVTADETSIREYFAYQRGSRLTHSDIYRQIEAAKPRVIEEALQSGILEKAETNIHKLLEGFMLSLGFTTVIFETVEA